MTSRIPAVVPRYMPLLLLAAGWEALTRSGLVPTAALPPLDTVAIAGTTSPPAAICGPTASPR
jgi:ABC-type nitrate/sulfonate/bicarbonate transport system permease component